MNIRRIITCALMAAIGMGALSPDICAAKRKKSKRKTHKVTRVAKVKRVSYDTPVTTGDMVDAAPFVTFEREIPITKGLDNRIIALWQSHGMYYDVGQQRWHWQRPQLFGTVEDLFPQGFVIPYLMPMLENAGAYVMSPRERDVNTTEIIIDTDGSEDGDFYLTEGKHKWKEGKHGSGFALPKHRLVDGDNPFTMGTSEVVSTVDSDNEKKQSTAVWNATLPQRGRYAVYVSYASKENSATDASYTINHLGGSTHVTVNQQMGGGTWIYLGHYDFAAGKQSKPIVVLTNVSDDEDAVVSADAVKIGGGMGNVARASKGNEAYANVSGSPRFTEGARYWLQWAGMPRSVYSESGGTNDYTDDYKCRAHWVNYLAGGSEMLPDSAGLNIPIDLAFAFHTDAGTTSNGSVVGTLGIYSTDDGTRLGNNRSRSECGDLANAVVRQVTNDISALHRSDWTSRGVRDKKYYEIRATKVPAMILELLSHQNFEDMKYGLDPQFRFDVSRAVYKGILKFLCKRYGVDYVVQPLPVHSFAITAGGAGRYRLSWEPTADTLEPTAGSTYYVIEERLEGGGFSPIATVTSPQYDLKINDNYIHSYRIVAGNDGGVSFPSEVLALYDTGSGKPDVNIVNGFTRISAPENFSMGSYSGFNYQRDSGVADGCDMITTGHQYDYDSTSEYESNDRPGYGASRGNLARMITAGNTHDYAWLHGRAIKAAGKGFVSQSVGSYVDNTSATALGTPAHPLVVDLILGKQKEMKMADDSESTRFKAFPVGLQNKLKAHCEQGGALLLSGSYIGSDLFENSFSDSITMARDCEFATTTLGYTLDMGKASVDGKAAMVLSPNKEFSEREIRFAIHPSADIYSIESPDGIKPVGLKAFTFMRYDETGMTAASAFENTVTTATGKTTYRVVAIGFPFEIIDGENTRTQLMREVLKYFKLK
jgi:N-acetylmuramoyl-L-alanine amidase